MKMHAMMSFDYPNDEEKLRRAINADQMFETLVWIRNRIEEGRIEDDNPDAVLTAVMDRVSLSFKLIGDPDA